MKITALSQSLTAYKNKHGLTTSALARHIGVSSLGLARVMSGRSHPNARTAARYATGLGLSAKQIQSATMTVGRAAMMTERAARPARRGPGLRDPGASSMRSALAVVATRLDQAGQIADDRLAMAVHRLSAANRATVSRVLARLG